MKQSKFLFGLFLPLTLCLIVLPLWPHQKPLNRTESPRSSQSISPTIPENIQEHIQSIIDNNYSQGIVAAKIDSNGIAYFSYGKTSKDGTPVDENTIYEIGSITKVFTAVLLADLVQQGLAALNDPVEKYLPQEVKMPEMNEKITLEHLATHQSGLPVLPTNFPLRDPALYAAYNTENLYAFLSDYSLSRDPNTKYEYSNLGAGLLGHVLSLITGKSYEQMVINYICDPLKIKATRVTLSEEQQQRMARGHFMNGRETRNWDFDCLAGCGALRSSASDLSLFVAANLGIYKTDLYLVLQLTHQARAGAGQPDMQIGLGWHILTIYGTKIIWHNGGTGGYRSFCGFVPDQSIGVVVLSNSNYNYIDPIGFSLLEPKLKLPTVKKR